VREMQDGAVVASPQDKGITFLREDKKMNLNLGQKIVLVESLLVAFLVGANVAMISWLVLC